MSDVDLRRRLERVVDFVAQLAAGDFQARLAISERHDDLDAVAVSLNILAEDFGVERSLRQASERNLRDAVDAYDSAPSMFCSVEPFSHVVVRCNQTLERALGRDRSAIVGQPLESLYAPTSKDLGTASVRAFVEGTRPPSGDHELMGAGGRRIPTLLSGSVVRDESGAIRRVRLIFRDVSEERQLESQLTQAQKMDEIGRLAGGVAHDFNNLLTAIIGCAELLRPSIPADSAEDLQELLGAANRAAELTSQLLAFSRRTVVRPQHIQVDVSLLNMEKLLQRTLGAQISIRTVTEPGPWTVFIDPARLEQVIMNLAVNARDAMPRGGRLTLETQNVVLDDDYAAQHLGVTAGEHVMLAVSDDGVGMGRDVLDRLFEPFFTTKEVGQGTGLGLSMVYGIIRQAGGSVAVYSEVGVGTSFKVYLPRAEGVARTATPALLRLPRGGNELILVVEDDSMVRSVVTRTLRSRGYQVIESGDGEDATENARNVGCVDLLITDLVMPRLGGRELSKQLEALGLCRRVLFVSGYTSNAIAPTLEPGVTFLQKPFTPSVLLARVREVLDGPSLLSAR